VLPSSTAVFEQNTQHEVRLESSRVLWHQKSGVDTGRDVAHKFGAELKSGDRVWLVEFL
jgi:hypothetical protein